MRSEIKEFRNLEVVPSFGGLAILLIINYFFWDYWEVIMLANLFGILGFIDDVLKVFSIKKKGLSIKVRLFFESAAALIFVHLCFLQDASRFVVPFLGNMWIFNYLWGAFVIIGTANAMNLTDGVDSLASTTSIFVLLFIGLKFNIMLPFILIFAILGFLLLNFPPARIYMGDVGALSIGAAIGGLYFKYNFEVALPFIGGIFVLETLCSALQIFYIRKLKRKLFLFSPLHHHFEKKGWAESTVVIRFWIISIISALIGLATLKLR